MKKLIIAFVAVTFSTVMFTQAQGEKKMESKSATEKKMATHCYAMKDGAMTHCMGTTGEPMTKDATLKNGTTVSTKGEITTKDGKKSMLANGQCISPEGVVGDFDKMHPGAKKEKGKM